MKAGAVARQVIGGGDAGDGDAVALAAAARAAIDALARDEKIEVALLIFPSVTMSAAAFDQWCAPLRAANPAFVAAVFHPETPYELATAAQAVGFFRRAPDPTLQLVRQSVLDALRGAGGKMLFDFSAAAWAELKKREHRLPPSERIARDNHELLVREGVSTLQAIYDDIRADRERSYGGG
ncbi:MAG: hypothetical protein JWN44_6012 [Myxococcales bacterium]|nr:hypothetical protein [Myxococcales bacterium]